MPATHNGDNALLELAQAMTAGGQRSTATALRKLAYEGYSSMEQVDKVPDWVLLSIQGIGMGRLAAVRRLSCPDWQPPSTPAIQAGVSFLAATRFALRYWPPATLADLIQGSALPEASGRSVGKQLALDVFSQAVRKALRYCETGELVQALWHERGEHAISTVFTRATHFHDDMQRPTLESCPTKMPASDLTATSDDEKQTARDSDRFAHPHHRRLEIVQHYWAARESGQVQNKDAWARSHYHISGKTLLCYEREFTDQKQDILAAAAGR